ncbi:uncharacterized protein PHACADRAFT_211409 [Phanerochaete carnosa HHB-10118-sp]|uniref:Heterokaryon incompatibility domain-containing protein n=1 Tax=Phanerochaete carnosa (strain HHB-10118-sp) TaxID=650164 RepID=K5W3Q9_PHACS|nr:uncharacterized protein PHACADRAFT_211409 [Phanerochaete carnosa HHB-10118-sp]EKM53760.1 hypothetical protein PHACADRAFT_211409 [Phanerochaete carnosa HHB-10118-sp]
MPCAAMNTSKSLKLLNDILGTRYTLGKPGLEQCLDHFIRNSRDFGQVYGALRCHWQSDFTRLLSDIAAKQKREEVMQKNALDGGYISNSQVSPRRVWDLYSNRVLPFYAIDQNRNSLVIPDNIWTVSHSWVHENARIDVSTPINDYKWPVPIPNNTTFDHIRVELLNLGAEYVWLDVLCMRQRGRPEDEEQRKEEWKLDVPTIGSVYSLDRPCVTYFNGLGLPFDPSPQVLSSDRHWLKRVWTVQEATDLWLPGGITGATSTDTQRFFRELLPRSIPQNFLSSFDHLAFAVRAMQGRHCTAGLDRVHGLAYILNCKTLPIYDEGMPTELAWTALLKHIGLDSRWRVALRHARRHPNDTSLLPSWKDFMQYEQEGNDIHSWYSVPGLSDLYLLDHLNLHTPEPGTYFHKVIAGLYGSIDIDREGTKDSSGHKILRFQDAIGALYEITATKVGGTFLRGAAYLILKFTSEVWLVVEVIGRRLMGEQMVQWVVKRGCIFPLLDPIPYRVWGNRWVVYVSEGEVREKKSVFRRLHKPLERYLLQ